MNPQTADPIWMQVLTLVADVLKIFLGAFFGAACAFAYERRRKRDDERHERTVALRDAQFALIARINSLLVIHKQHLAPQARNPNRWVELPPVLNVTTPPLIPMGELSFLLDDIDPNLLGELVVARNKFDTVCEIIVRRNEKHDEFQRLYEKGEISERLQVQLTHFTDALYEQLSDAVVFLHSVHGKLDQLMQKHFKGVNVLRFGHEVEQMIKDLQPEPERDGLKHAR
jgi:hypothetical protein